MSKRTVGRIENRDGEDGSPFEVVLTAVNARKHFDSTVTGGIACRKWITRKLRRSDWSQGAKGQIQIPRKPAKAQS